MKLNGVSQRIFEIARNILEGRLKEDETSWNGDSNESRIRSALLRIKANADAAHREK
jgi:hypothetical protein